MTNTDRPPPPFVQGFAQKVTAELDRIPTVVARSSRRWEIRVEEGNIRATAVVKVGPDGRCRQVEGRLTVNGEERPTMDWDGLRQLLDNELQPVTPEPAPEPVNPALAPALVRKQMDDIRSGLSDEKSAEIVLGRHGHGWQIAIDFPTGSLRVYFHKYRNRWHQWTPRGLGIQLIIKGVDYTQYVNGELGQAISMLGAEQSAAERPGTLGHTENAKASNAVTVRRSTVIRV